MSEFMIAVQNGDLEKVKAFLGKDKSLLTARNKYNDTALHLATWQGHERIVSYLLQQGADVHDIGRYGRNALMKAANCKKDNSNALRILVKAGARVNDKSQDEKEQTNALSLSCEFSHPQTVKTLLALGADVNMKRKQGWEPIHAAAHYASVETLEALLNAGADVNARSDGNETPVISAAVGNQPDNIKLLCLHGGELDAVTTSGRSALHWASVLTDGRTALHWACKEQHGNSISVLLALGASRSIKDKMGRTPLDVAREKKCDEIVQMLEANAQLPELHRSCLDGQPAKTRRLLEAGASSNQQDSLDRTALHLAVIKRNVALIKLLMKYKADPDIPDEDFSCPIHYACAIGFTPAVNALIDVCDINAPNQDGLTPLMIAIKGSKIEIVNILLKLKGIEVKNQDNNSNNILHHACEAGNKDILRLLLSCKPPPILMTRNHHNNSPLVVAAKNHHASLVRLILLELVPESNIERSLTTFTHSTRGLDASVRILPTNLAIEVIHNTLDDDLVQFVLYFKDSNDRCKL